MLTCQLLIKKPGWKNHPFISNPPFLTRIAALQGQSFRRVGHLTLDQGKAQLGQHSLWLLLWSNICSKQEHNFFFYKIIPLRKTHLVKMLATLVII